MKAWQLDSLTGLSALHLRDVPDPAPAPGQAVLSIGYASLNPADRYLAQGEYPGRPVMPHILGRDGIGVVTQVGAGVDIPVGAIKLILRGDTGVNLPGTFAQQTAVAVENLVDPPAGWSEQECAAAPLVYLTAWQALTMWSDLPAGSAVLVTGASGGVGVASVQLAKAMGYSVAALSRDPAKQTRLRELGADFVTDGSQDGWARRLRDQMGGRRIDLAIDNIGGAQFSALLETLGDRGRVSCVGRLAGPVPQFNTAALFFRRIRLGGVAVGAFTPPESRDAWLKVVNLMQKTGIRPLVDSVFPMEELPRAFERLAAGPMGKVLLSVGGGV